MHLDDIQRDNTTDSFTRGSGVKYMVVDLGGMCVVKEAKNKKSTNQPLNLSKILWKNMYLFLLNVVVFDKNVIMFYLIITFVGFLALNCFN